jgi:RNA polymerase sigma-70 factor (ECF subfamily)
VDDQVGSNAPAAESPVTDACIITRSLEDPEVFAELFDRHAARIFRYAAIRVGPDAADDVMSETFYVAFRNRRSYELSRDNARPWLFGIATHLIGQRRKVEARHWRTSSRIGEPAWHEDGDDAIVERVSAQAVRAELALALARLPARYRDVLLLIALGDLDYSEAACALRVYPSGPSAPAFIAPARGCAPNWISTI